MRDNNNINANKLMEEDSYERLRKTKTCILWFILILALMIIFVKSAILEFIGLVILVLISMTLGMLICD